MSKLSAGVPPAMSKMNYRQFPKQVSARITTPLPPARIWQEIEQIGGERGWYYLDILWRLRGALDTLVGGVGMRRKKRAASLKKGGVLDFYSIVEVEAERQLTLLVELKMPGDGFLEFLIGQQADGLTRVDIAAYFNPRGIVGLAYWNALLPVHRWVFDGLCAALLRRAGGEVR